MQVKKLTLVFIITIIGYANLLFAQTATAPSSGDGTGGNPYQIGTLENLYWIAASNAVVPSPSQATRWSAAYMQGADIDASATSGWNSGAGWSPIGDNSVSFTGSYIGGYIISGLYISRSGSDYQGLFGKTNGATIQNVHLTSMNITGNGFVGGLVGNTVSSYLVNCFSTGSITGTGVIGGIVGHNITTNMNNCYSTCSVIGSSQYVGGLVGYNMNSSTLTNCYSLGSVSGTFFAGGLLGYNKTCSVSNCFSTGNVTGVSILGGLVGKNITSGILSNCYSISSVSGTNTIIGGLVGENDYSSQVNYCYSTGIISGSSNVGGLLGSNLNSSTVNNSFWDTESSRQSSSAGGTGKTTAEMKQAGTYLSAGWDFTLAGNIWAMNGTDSSGYPFLRTQSYTPAAIWLGTSTLWANTGNWSENSVPSGTVIIPNVTNDPIISSSGASCNKLTIESGGALTISPSGYLDVNGTLTNNGTLTLQSDATGTATLKDNGTSNIATANVQQYLTGSLGTTYPNGRFWYVATPITGVKSAVFDAAADANKLWYYTESEHAYTEITNNTTDLAVGTGYVARMGSNPTLAFSGTMFTGNKDIALSYTADNAYSGFNLIGNPYPSFLDWNQVVLPASVNPTIWVRSFSGTAMGFDTYNASDKLGVSQNGHTVTKYIAPLQAFWVEVTAASSITVTNAMRSVNDQTVLTNKLKAPAVLNATQQVLRLQVSNGINSDESLLVFNANASDGFDAYDSHKMLANDPALPEIYSLAGTDKLAINCMNKITSDEVIPLGFTTGEANTFTLKATQADNFADGTEIILKDKLLNTEQNLTDGTAYTFTSDATTTADRFTVLFRTSSAITGTVIPGENQGVRIEKNGNGQISVNFENEMTPTGTISVYNVTGQKLVSIIPIGSITVINKNFASGVYFVNVQSAGKTTIQKIVIE